jgi:hypothetical protein
MCRREQWCLSTLLGQKPDGRTVRSRFANSQKRINVVGVVPSQWR